MPKRRHEEDTPPKGVLTTSGHQMVNNLVHDLLRPKSGGRGEYRRDAVTFIRDPQNGDHIIEVNSGKTCDVRYLKRE